MKRTTFYVDLATRSSVCNAVRVVVDPADETMDYFMPERYAREEFIAGRLEQIQDGPTWIYSDPGRKHWIARLRDRGLR